jgi:hypothetical protein
VKKKAEGKCSISVLHRSEAAREESSLSRKVGADKETYMQQQETKKKGVGRRRRNRQIIKGKGESGETNCKQK